MPLGSPEKSCQASHVTRSVLVWAPLAAVLLVFPAWAEDGHGHPASASEGLDLTEHVPGAAALEGRIIAPCCWTQTIDIHGSPASTELRREIRARLKAGESVEAVESSLVERYAATCVERDKPRTCILATTQDSGLGKTGVLLAIAMGAAGVGAVGLLRRWQRRGATEAEQPKDLPERNALDERLDAELSRLE